ncbi:Gldg family protein [Myxosarcina sp. GI1]|uniref:GldG family protein n=1 Tax=Myxosarcina sp. GI1 TaxID=1541065 RepID=UPI00055DB942|nr:Gldg family protein [Myxosarcina sp. GI1]
MITKILFLLGLALGVAGLVAGGVGEWSLIPILLLAAGVILIVISLAIASKNRGIWSKRSTQVGTNALITTVSVLVILGLINFLGVRHAARWDLTENQIFTLSTQSQAIAKNIEQPLKVWVFERNPNPELENLLENYRRYSSNFQYEFVDPDIEIAVAREFGVTSPGEIYLEYNDKRQQITLQSTALGENLTETQLTNAIANIKRDRNYTIYFLQGHGESSLEAAQGGLSQAVGSLENKGYTVETFNLAASGSIPDNADVVVIAGATRTLLAGEVEALQQYIDNGGNLLLMLSPDTETGFGSLLNNWGIEIDDRLIIDGSGAGNVLGLGPAVLIINSYGNHPITNSFGNGISIFPESLPLEIQEREAIDTTPLIVSGDNTWGESDLAGEITFDPESDLRGPLNVAIASSKQQPQSSRLVVFGSSTFATNGWFEQQLNGDIFLNSVDWLIGENETVLAVRPREQTNRRINLTPLQAGLISWMALIIMPLLGLVIGVILWWRRR